MQTVLNTEREVLSRGGDAILASLWILLFGGRWIIGTLLIAAGIVNFDQLSDWDDGIGIHLYHVMLIATVVILALRAIRSRSGSQSPQYSHERNETSQNHLPADIESHTPDGRGTL